MPRKHCEGNYSNGWWLSMLHSLAKAYGPPMSNDNRIGHTNGNFNVGLNLTKAKMDRILPAEQIKSCLWTKLACGLFLIGESGTYKSLTSLDDELLGSENFLLTTYMYMSEI
ncbi:hypothetical protein D5086_014753 [Populus alba]|uniref:Uncharacterized protein n=1 Tax=Populus alba TaxID=43335 RepID=A0ACC4BZ32_POPAL